MGFSEAGDPLGGGGEGNSLAGLTGPDAEPGGQVGLIGAGSEGDRLQHLRAVLPCEVRVVAETHPLCGKLLSVKSFKRWNGVLLLVVDLPDGSPGTIRADATDVMGPGTEAAGGDVVLNAAGLRELYRLVHQLATSHNVAI
ncbi:hypothetical protein ACWGQ5_19110 [Streptomyces sp. NPDC055722]